MKKTVLVENCSSIHIGSLQKIIKKILKKNLIDPTKEELLEKTREELLNFRVNNQTFEYYHSKTYLGGFRWFFVCSKCKSKAYKLYLPPEGTGREQLYLCKYCHNLRNLCSINGNQSGFNKVNRKLLKLREIEKRIDRGYLKTDALNKLMDDYERIEKEIREIPEYRLYVFKKKHGLELSKLF